jgi:aspartate/methionine/tyrosine aminotransferase
MIDTLKGINFLDLRYPKPHGMPKLRETIVDYYREHYGSDITSDNVMVFAGGKPALWAIMLFLRKDVNIRIARAEYPAYFAMIERLGLKHTIVESNEKNGFCPSNADYIKGKNSMALFSNPGNPTGITKKGADLADFVKLAS